MAKVRLNNCFRFARGWSRTLTGGLLGSIPSLVLAAIAVCAAIGSLSSPRIRLWVVVLGALLVFQTDSDTAKAGYLTLVALVLLASLANLLTSQSSGISGTQILRGASLMSVSVAAGVIVSAASGTPPEAMFRDSLPYALLPLLVLVGWQLGADIPATVLRRDQRLITIIASVSLAVDWLSRRGAGEDVNRILLGSTVLVLWGLASQLGNLSGGSRSRSDLIVTSIAASSLLITGNRTNLVVLIAVVIYFLAARRRDGSDSGARAVIAVQLTALVLVALPLGMKLFDVPTTFLTDRFRLLLTSVSGGLQEDQSYQFRQNSYDLALQSWQASPILGNGFGVALDPTAAFTLDTPWVTLAKLGVVGTAVLLGGLVMVCRAVAVPSSSSAPVISQRCFLISLALLTPFGAWIEDKGTAIAIMLMIATFISGAVEASSKEIANELTEP